MQWASMLWYSELQKVSTKSGMKLKTAPPLMTVLFAGKKDYFQPKTWLRIQSVTAMDTKNRPKPTGLPQLNHEPHERQCFRLFS